MNLRTLMQVAGAINGELIGPDAPFTGVSTDSRQLADGNLFVALTGPRFDGHVFLAAAREAGAAGAIVSRALDVPLPQILVADTQRALQRLAAQWRSGFAGPVIGLTGSNGKTTVKEMLRAILAEGGATLATEGNLNNEIGVPLTLLRLASAHRWAVVEMGANHAGEIARLTRLANPTVGLLINAAAAHLEGFGSREGVARAKGELFENLAPGATAVVNADDRWASMWLASCGKRPVLRFALDADAEFTATDVRETGDPLSPALEFRLVTPLGESDVRLPMLGSHNVANALAAAAAAIAAGASLGQVRRGLAAVANVAGRLTAQPGLEGCTVYDDSYNANPASVAAAIGFLASRSGARVLVLGDLGELGADAAVLHREVGQRARDAGLDLLIGVGPLSRGAVEAFGPGAVAVDD
ncbi:MAG: UDP-N-acetylmuramoyl-tripeptide--D-alanyl-D-alanine ligase, partial [Gammaproteobacteria bacterium]|nr:UDP-N-acetylmuramoyl-tripeptide--D-alanyl-D-alanine ligase [Gammaproteobacteria bacterium]